MTLSVKAAMMICIGCVGGISWLVHGIEPADDWQTSPLVISENPVALARQYVEPELAMPVATADPQENWDRRFATPNAFDRELAARTESAKMIDVALLPAPTPEEGNNTPELAYAVGPEPGEQSVTPIDTPAPLGEYATGPVVAGEPTLMDEPVAASEPVVAGEVVLAADVEPAEDQSAVLELRDYRVVRGDTLLKIMDREWTTREVRVLELLVQLNPQLRGRQGHILVGEELSLPDNATVERVLAGDWPTELSGDVERTTLADVRWYTIRRNDSLSSIARQHLHDARRWREILELNESLDPDRIFPGTRIKLPPVRVATR